ncbi:hypothetical protein Skr01_22520 [Sphaerisporangium krabiense]|uniref:Uncharacterized protein n=1 Tax=Sphaerisporangium krabiense TaxID=763782 RepID=A0A7W8Z6I9_9ACTN|nr:nucleotidyltransferase family protein [Sphaerisporangium krabiense]MBB5628003.1 hypothetical protein [Sphaerisporangium krabiense]GII62167.1 hypothetical protein Skr01_22520 [Sphaerisporangium krabiense]
MIGLTSGELEEILATVTGQDMETPGEVLHVTRTEQPSFLATLLSAWERDGRELGPGLSHELSRFRGRMAFYRDLQERIAARFGDPVTFKGLEVAARYPEPLVRTMNDLDYWVPDEDRVWPIVTWLVEEGWALHSATFLKFEGRLQFLVSMRRQADDPYGLPYAVELSTMAMLADRVGVPARRALPPPCEEPIAKNLVALLLERFEQPFRARDLVDAAVQLDGAPRHVLNSCALAVHEIGLWPEYAELAGLLDAASLEVPRLPGDLRTLTRAGRARRRATAARGLRRPMSFALLELQNRMMAGRSGPIGRRAWRLTESRVSGRTALEAGLVLFALPVAGDHHAERATLRERGGTLWADTPAGGFVLVHGEEIDEAALEGAQAVGGLGGPEGVEKSGEGDA